MSSNDQYRRGSAPILSGDAQLQLIRRYARILRSAPAERARVQRGGERFATQGRLHEQHVTAQTTTEPSPIPEPGWAAKE